MIERVSDDPGIWPRKIIADTDYGSAEMLVWLVHERDIKPHIPMFDTSACTNGTFSRGDLAGHTRNEVYTCLAGKMLKRRQRRHNDRPDHMSADGISDTTPQGLTAMPVRSSPVAEACKVLRSVHDGACDLARSLREEDE